MILYVWVDTNCEFQRRKQWTFVIIYFTGSIVYNNNTFYLSLIYFINLKVLQSRKIRQENVHIYLKGEPIKDILAISFLKKMSF